MGALDRVRSNPKLAVGIACGVILVAAWIAWAIHVTSAHGSRAGLGVILAWPAMIGALALISLAVIGGYLLLRSSDTDGGASVPPAVEGTHPGTQEDESDEPAPEGEQADAPAKG